ncbi:MAG: FG-GAP-like repeat-containing protein, partial [Bacteroidota bacterium]
MNAHNTLRGVLRRCWVALCCLLVSYHGLLAENPTDKPYKVLGIKDVATIHSINYGPLYSNSSFNSRSINTARPVGTTTGSHQVNMSGGASYGIPIFTPPGTRNLVPNVSLVYSSQAGNGPLGRGWNIGGLSVISRKGHDFYRDEAVKQVLFDNYDHFTLDGNVLVPVSGANGHNNTIYRTENETFAKVVSKGTSGNGPDWFEVTTRDGVKMEFGKSFSSQRNVQGGSTAMAWFINKLYDQYGNYIEFIYDYNYTDTRIKEIKYTGNSSAGITPYNSIKFFWDLRSDDNRIYQWGSYMAQRHLLEKVEVRTEGNQLVKKYEMEYGFDNIQSYLTSVTESGSAGGKLNATIFKYGDDPTPFQAETCNYYPWFNKDVFTGDFNGDGHSDFLEAVYSEANGFRYHTSFRVYKRQPSFNNFTATLTVNLPPTQYEIVDDEEIPHFQSFIASDFNGNGQDDVLLIDKSYDGSYTRMKEIKVYYPNDNLTAYNAVAYPTTTPFNIIYPGGKYFFPGDYTGDGRADYLTVLSNGTGYKVFFSSPGDGVANEEVTVQNAPNSYYPGSIFATAEHVAPLDFNGDGKQDLMVTSWGWTKIYTFYEQSNGTWFAQQIYGGGYPVQTGNGNPGNDIFVGDFNGDGKSDVLTRDGTSHWNYKVGFSDGKTFHQENFPVSYAMNPDDSTHHIRIADVNGDGFSDVVHVVDSNPDRVNVYYGKGQSVNNDFYYQSYSFTSNSYIGKVLVGDFNGDGKLNMALEGAENQFYNLLYFDKEGTNHLLHKVANGYNHTTEFRYKRLTEGGSFYTPGTQSSYPLYDFQKGVHFVSEVRVPDGLSGQHTTSYQYEEGIVHGRGKGFLGFKKVVAESSAEGMKISSEFEIDPTYFASQLKTQEKRLIAGNSLISELNHVNHIHHFGNKRIWPRITSTTQTNHLSNTDQVTSYAYDTNGNLTQSTENLDNGLEVTVSQFSYTANGTWLPAILWKTIRTKYRAGSAALVNTAVNYYNSKGAVIQRINHYGEPKAVNTYFTIDGATGVVTRSKMQASGMANREINYAYDSKKRFVTTETRALGQAESRSYDPGFGTLLSHTLVDGLSESTTYDQFGRQLSFTNPLGHVMQTSLHWDIQSGNGSSSTSADNSIFYVKTTASGTPETRTWFDILSRPRLDQRRGYSNQWIKTVTSYDARGNIRTRTLPFSSGSAVISTHQYDAYNRPVSVSNSFGTQSYSYAFSGGNLTTTSTNPAGQTSSKTTDPSGKTIATSDAGGSLTHTFDSFGRVVQTKLNGVEVAAMTYDQYGNQTQLEDKNGGITHYAYNAYGERTMETNPNGQVTQSSYDLLGRMTTRVVPEGTITYQYVGNGLNGEGKIKKVTHYNGNSQEFSYNNLSQNTLVKENIDGTTFNTSFSYDGNGRVVNTIFPSGFGVTRHYTSLGYLASVKNLAGSVTLYNTLGMNDFDQPTAYYMGDGKTTTKTYNALGMPTRILGGNVQDLQFSFNTQSGNLNYRYDAKKGRLETFQYDNLNRLTRSQVVGQSSINVNYASNGNIQSKTGIGSYTYHSQKHNAVTKICDASGPISHDQQDIQFTSFMQPSQIAEGNLDFDLTYGPDGERRKMETVHSSNGLIGERYYAGAYEKDIQNGTTRELHYIYGGDGLAAIVVKQNGQYQYYYTYKDYLGSILTVTTSAGAVAGEQNFDAWGRKRNVSSWNYSNVGTTPAWLYRGYTGHEHLDEVDLINMNGRMYDPLNGRMLSVDNFVQNPEYSQSYNRYAYAFNNPLKYTDPNGEIAFVPILAGMAYGAIIGAATSVAVYSVTVAITGQEWSWGDFGRAAAMGAIGGALGGGLGALGGQLGTFGQSLGYNILTNVASNTATTLAFGGEVSTGDVFGMVVGGILGAGIGNFNGVKGGALKNIGAELAFRIGKGGITGGVGGAIGSAIDGENVVEGMLMGAQNGAIAGGTMATLNILTMGAAYVPAKKYGDFGRDRPVYRRGTFLTRALAKPGSGMALGRNLITHEFRKPHPDHPTLNYLEYNEYLRAHETGHFQQQRDMGFANFYAKILHEYITVGFVNS